MVQQNRADGLVQTLLARLRAECGSMLAIAPEAITQQGWLKEIAQLRARVWWVAPQRADILMLVDRTEGAAEVRLVEVARGVHAREPERHVMLLRPVSATETEVAAAWTVSEGRTRSVELVLTNASSDYAQLEGLLVAPGRLTAAVQWLDQATGAQHFFRRLRGLLPMLRSGWQPGDDYILTEDDRTYLSLLLVARLIGVHFLSETVDAVRGALGWLLSLADDQLWLGWEQLCFEGLNAEDGRPEHLADVPFLNGGLYSPLLLDYRHPRLESGVFRSVLGWLSEFGFSSAVWDRHAIDPGVVGRLYETFMVVRDREQTGTYYTPYALARRMAQKAVDELLGVTVDLHSSGQTREQLDRLYRLRTLDPACGSGALLLAMLDVLTSRALELHARLDATPMSEALVRRRLAAQLYGTDVSPLATTLCELRVWLSILQADIRCEGSPRPLPNLSHHLRVGDSLVSQWDWNVAHPSHAIHPSRLQRQRELQQSLCHLHGAAKVAVAAELRELETSIGRTMRREARDAQHVVPVLVNWPTLFDVHLPVVPDQPLPLPAESSGLAIRGNTADLEVVFADVLADGGFDVIIGNPPWLRLSDCPPKQRAMLKSRYTWMGADIGRAFGAQADISIAFVERSLQVCREDGVVALLLPSKHLSALYARRMRQNLQRQDLRKLELIQHDVASQFSADTYPLWMMLRKKRVSDVGASLHVTDAFGQSFHVKPSRMCLDHDAEQKWLLYDEGVLAVLGELVQRGKGDWGWPWRAVYGVKTGLNEAYVLKGGEGSGVEKWVSGLVRGRDVGTMRVQEGGRIVLPYEMVGAGLEDELRKGRGVVSRLPPSRLRLLEELPGELAGHFEKFEGKLRGRADYQGGPWWRVFRLGEEVLGWRVIWRDIAGMLEAAPLRPVWEGGPVALNTLYVVGVETEEEAVSLAAWLNLTPARLVAAGLAEPALGGYRRFRVGNVCQVPVPRMVYGVEHEWHGAFVRAAMNWWRGDEGARVRLEEMAMLEVGFQNRLSEVVRASRLLGLSRDPAHFSNFVV